MKKYILNYVADLGDADKRQYRGQGWTISFEPAEEHIEHYQRIRREVGSDEPLTQVVVIHARDYLAAYKVARLVTAAQCLLEGSTFVLPPDHFIPYADSDEDEEGPGEIRLLQVRGTIMQLPDTPLACLIASRASRRKSLAFALFKLLWSFRTYSTDVVDLHPHWTSIILPKARTPEESVRYCQAITLAYGVIEELGLDVRASDKSPSRPGGKWNPEVREDLEKRLRKARVDLAEPVVWALRGSKTRLETGRPTKRLGKASHAYGRVRDEQVHVCDAIADISWLRSRVSAHKSSELVDLLSPYDVANAQHLAARLILDTLRISSE